MGAREMLTQYKKCGHQEYHETHGWFESYLSTQDYICLGYDNLWWTSKDGAE
ncbi:hypothetical protein SEA_UZUMAKI_71 [Arthrobacter phage Uzumaki]|nr:hypothetical protein SEA_UZUMAKI_71 [Arthrobacter phage Uzumaki]